MRPLTEWINVEMVCCSEMFSLVTAFYILYSATGRTSLDACHQTMSGVWAQSGKLG